MQKAAAIDVNKIDTSSAEFQAALKLVTYTSQSVFLTGKAGTGKSTFLKYLTAATKKKYVVLAPTGIAAINAGGQTIHSFFRIPFKPMLPNDPDLVSPQRLRQRFKYTKRHIKLLKNLDLIIIDEISMVRPDVIDLIDRLLRVYTGNLRRPFGGKQLLLLGDVFQLEPVIPADTRDILGHYYRDGMFFFNALAFRELPLVPIELRKAFRQTDPEFIALLDRMREGRPNLNDLALLNSKVGQQPPAESFTMTIATRREIVDSINTAELDKIPRPLRSFDGVITGDFPDSSLPTDRVLELKEGAQVVFVKNDTGTGLDLTAPAAPGDEAPARRWVNGTIGRVAEIGEQEIMVELPDGTKHAVKPEIWENVRYTYDEDKKEVKENVLGTFSQFPLKAAWAITIHKSQGLTFDRVSIDLGHGAFSGGQTYVALSRCRSLQGITMRSTIAARDVFVNPLIQRYAATFNDPVLIDSAMQGAAADAAYADAAKAFDEGRMRDAAMELCRAVAARNELGRPEAARLIAQKLTVVDKLKEQIKSLQDEVERQREMLRGLAAEYVAMGDQCREEGWEMEAALANYDKALRLNPGMYVAMLGRARALEAMERYDDAVEAYRLAEYCPGSDWRAPLEAGKLEAAVGDAAAALDLMLIALAKDGNQPDVHLSLASLYDKMGIDDQAARHNAIAQKLLRRRNK